jgi:hypothetical protein
MSVKNPVTSKKEALGKAELKAQEAVKSVRGANQRLERDQAAVEAAKAVVVAAKAKTDETAKALLDLYKKFYSKN